MFIDAAADIHRIPGDRADDPFRVDDKGSADRGAGVRARMQHAVGPRNFRKRIRGFRRGYGELAIRPVAGEVANITQDVAGGTTIDGFPS